MSAGEPKSRREDCLSPLVMGAALLLMASLRPLAAGASSPQKVWGIGQFDGSSTEFHRGAMPASVPVYVVEKSRPDVDWYAFQPGTANGEAGARPHPLTIQFDLTGSPRGLYSLKVGMLAQSRRLSILLVDLNGHRGWIYQRPQWRDVPGDKYWDDLATIQLPRADLRSGTNTLALTAIDKPSQRDDVNNSGITYDALELDRDSSQRFDPNAISVDIHPTIFYQRKDGQLAELLDVFISQNGAPGRGSLTLSVNGQTFTQPLSSGRDFGEQRIEFAVPAFAPGTRSLVVVNRGRRERRFSMTLEPAKKWTIYVVPHEHLDVGYTDYQSKVAEIHSRVVDEALHMMRENPQFRFSPDGYWVLQHFFAGRDSQDRDRLFQAIQAGKFFVPAQYANLLTGFPTVETLIRSLYPSFEFDASHHESFNYANITDVPSYTWSYASVLAAAGIKYFLAGCDQTRGPILNQSHLQEKSPFWWEGPDGKKVLMWYSDSYGQVGAFFGLPPQVAAGYATLPRFLQVYSSAEYQPSSILLFGAQWENSDLYPQQATIVEEWNKTYAYPTLRYSGFTAALEQIAKEDGDSIPVYRGDGGPYWEDGIASDSYYAAMNRETEQRALSAEKISTASSLVNPGTKPDRSLIEQLWQNLVLFDEHTWGAAGSVSSPESEETVRQLEVKDTFAAQAKQEAKYIVDRGLAALVDKIHDPSGTLVVFNPLNWSRSKLVEVDLPKGFQIVDLATNQTVPYEILSTSGNAQRIRFLARDVPSVGYKCYAVRHAASPPTSVQTQSGDFMENAYYRVAFDPQSGSVKSIFDKELRKELVNPSSPYRFDQYLYVTGADQPSRNRLLYNDPGLPVPALTVHPAGDGRLISITQTPFGVVARLESSAPNTPRIDSEIILFSQQKQIEFINHVHKQQVYTKEGVYFAFPLAMDHPEFRYELQNGYMDPAHDQLPGAGKEWFSVQHWVEAQQGDTNVALVPIDASLVTLGDIVQGTWPLKFGQRNGTIFSYIMNNYWFTNYRAGQGGDFTFRYLLSTDRRFQPAALSRLGWSAMTPFEVDQVIPNDKAVNTPEPLNAAENSFVNVESPNVVLVTWKQAEDRQGTIMRFLEVGGEAGNASVQIPLMDVQQAWQCNAMEEDQQQLPVSSHGFRFPVHPFQIVTVRLKGTMNLPTAVQ
ncbi:MAG TPA: polysaccharide lyase family protein [Terriglobia bacterium]|nr:polysaccharide lyase family protein [Terriglobia bacterium]